MSQRKFLSRHTDPVSMGQVHVSSSDEEDGSMDDEYDDEEEEFDLIEALNEMSVYERRKVYALKGLHDEYLSIRHKLREELYELQRFHHKALASLFDARQQIVTGERDITEAELAMIVDDATVKTKENHVNDEEKESATTKSTENENEDVKESVSKEVKAEENTTITMKTNGKEDAHKVNKGVKIVTPDDECVASAV
uniref:Uncharacterized protein n=1 Tax=Lygus hesperus TaxID=30085 RepID=A0A0A9XFI0_LYGHE